MLLLWIRRIFHDKLSDQKKVDLSKKSKAAESGHIVVDEEVLYKSTDKCTSPEAAIPLPRALFMINTYHLDVNQAQHMLQLGQVALSAMACLIPHHPRCAFSHPISKQVALHPTYISLHLHTCHVKIPKGHCHRKQHLVPPST